MVANHLQSMSKLQKSIVLCIYLSQKESQAQTLENLFASLTYQFLKDYSSVLRRKNMAELVHGVETRAGQTQKDKFVSILRSELHNCQRVYVIVDALDECDESNRHELEIQLNALRSDRVSVMITSRYMRIPSTRTVRCDFCEKSNLRIYHHCQICANGDFDLCEDCFDQHKSCKDKSHLLSEPYSAVEMDLIIPDQEIKTFVEWELEKTTGKSGEGYYNRPRSARSTTRKLAKACVRDPQLKSLITSTIVQNANGSYLFAKLSMDSLEQQPTLEEVKKILHHPFYLVEDYFNNTMHYINAQKKRFSIIANQVLLWIIYSYKPLTFEELQQAIAAMGENNGVDPDELLDVETLLSVTAGLVTIDSTHTMRLIHLSAQEYFNVYVGKWFPTAEMDIARAIMNYLSFEAISKPCLGHRDGPEFEARKRSHPFLLYAAMHWGDHARSVIHEPTIQAKVLQFVRNSSNLASCIQAAGWANPKGPTEWDPERVPSSLHECERFGLTPIIPELLKAGSDVDSQEATKIGPSPKDHALGKQSQPRVVTSTEEEFESPVIKDILRPPREKFPVREGVAPLKDAGKKGIPPGARWTKIARKLVNPEALEMGGERYEERVDHVIVLRVLTAEEIQRYAAETQEIRARRLFPSSPL